MLKAIIHHYDIYVGMLLNNAVDSLYPSLTYNDQNIGKLQLNLQRLITHIAIRRVGLNEAITLGAATIATREKSYLTVSTERLHKKLSHRRFTRTANGDVTHTDNRDRELMTLDDARVKKPMANGYHHIVDI
jgi:hypothetical protein